MSNDIEIQRQTVVDMAVVVSDLNTMLHDYYSEVTVLRARVTTLEDHIKVVEASREELVQENEQLSKELRKVVEEQVNPVTPINNAEEQETG